MRKSRNVNFPLAMFQAVHLSKSRLSHALILGLVFFGLYALFPYFQGYEKHRSSVLYWIGYQVIFSDQGKWLYCFAVPFLSLFMIWNRRGEWKGFVPTVVKTWQWLPLFLGAWAFYWLGYATDVYYAGYLSLHLFLGATILGFFGREAFRRLLFPWLFLLFAFPMPFLDGMIAFPLRLLMSSASHHLLNFFGSQNEQTGTAILSAAQPDRGLATGQLFALDVADPCSGIRSLFALLMISALAGYLMFARSPLKIMIVFLAAIPLVILGNIARILLLAAAGAIFGSEWAIGSTLQPSWWHEAAGYFVYLIELIGLRVVILLLESRHASLWPRSKKSSPPV